MTRHDLESTQPTSPRLSTRAPAGPIDLDAQIEQLEQRLVAREAWMLFTAQSLSRRAQHAVTPRSWWLPTLGGAAVLWLGWHWWQGRAPAPPTNSASPVADTVHRPDRLAALPWAGLVALGWPLLPIAWRSRFSPAAATAAFSTLLVIVRRLRSRRSR